MNTELRNKVRHRIIALVAKNYWSDAFAIARCCDEIQLIKLLEIKDEVFCIELDFLAAKFIHFGLLPKSKFGIEKEFIPELIAKWKAEYRNQKLEGLV